MAEAEYDETRIPDAPEGTGPGGARLWASVVGVYVLEEHELALLREAVRTVDTLDVLAGIVDAEGMMAPRADGTMRVHPALVEARQMKIALARLLAALRLPAGAEGDHQEGARPQRRVGARGVYTGPLRAVR